MGFEANTARFHRVRRTADRGRSAFGTSSLIAARLCRAPSPPKINYCFWSTHCDRHGLLFPEVYSRYRYRRRITGSLLSRRSSCDKDDAYVSTTYCIASSPARCLCLRCRPLAFIVAPRLAPCRIFGRSMRLSESRDAVMRSISAMPRRAFGRRWLRTSECVDLILYHTGRTRLWLSLII